MAISNTASRNTYTLDAVTTTFDITFDVVLDDNGDAKELEVWLIDTDGNRTEINKGYASDEYTVSYKTVTYLDATSHAGDTLLITRATPRTQEVDFINNGAYNLNMLEAMSDKLTRIEQEQDATIADRIVIAEDAADRAAQSAQDAEESALDASSSETNAGISETNAGVSETNAASSALVSEGWAKGTQNGTPVGNTSPYYQNNSKYYADTVSAHSVALTYLDTYSSNIDTVAGINSDITTVAGISSNVTSVASNSTNINTVATNVSDVGTVATNVSDVNIVASNVSDVSAVAGDLTNIDAVASNATNINAVAGNSTNINAVAGNSTNINTVATNASDVNTVSTNMSDINDIADNLTDILAADDYASLSRQYDEGKKLDGTPVTSGEEGYENNAKYWADVASHYAVGTLVKIVRW